MVELIKYESRRIDPCLKLLTGDSIPRSEGRFIPVESQVSLPHNCDDLDDPFATTEKILAHSPEANS